MDCSSSLLPMDIFIPKYLGCQIFNFFPSSYSQKPTHIKHFVTNHLEAFLHFYINSWKLAATMKLWLMFTPVLQVRRHRQKDGETCPGFKSSWVGDGMQIKVGRPPSISLSSPIKWAKRNYSCSSQGCWKNQVIWYIWKHMVSLQILGKHAFILLPLHFYLLTLAA